MPSVEWFYEQAAVTQLVYFCACCISLWKDDLFLFVHNSCPVFISVVNITHDETVLTARQQSSTSLHWEWEKWTVNCFVVWITARIFMIDDFIFENAGSWACAVESCWCNEGKCFGECLFWIFLLVIVYVFSYGLFFLSYNAFPFTM